MVIRTRNSTTESNKGVAAKAVGNGAQSAGRSRPAVKDRAVPEMPAARQQLIAEAAYYLAEHRGFSPGSELEDWLQAEREVELGSAGSMH